MLRCFAFLLFFFWCVCVCVRVCLRCCVDCPVLLCLFRIVLMFFIRLSLFVLIHFVLFCSFALFLFRFLLPAQIVFLFSPVSGGNRASHLPATNSVLHTGQGSYSRFAIWRMFVFCSQACGAFWFLCCCYFCRCFVCSVGAEECGVGVRTDTVH